MKSKFFLLSAFLYIGCNAIAQSPTLDWAKGIEAGDWDARAYAVATDKQENAYFTGYYSVSSQTTVNFDGHSLTPNGNGDIYVAKYDKNGNFQWAKTMGSLTYGDEQGADIAVDASGNTYITGYFDGPTAQFGSITVLGASGGGQYSYNPFVCKLNTSGTVLWVKVFKAPPLQASDFNLNWGKGIEVDASGNVYSTGYFYGTVDFDPGTGTHNVTASSSGAAYISKLTTNGNFVWVKKFDGTKGRAIALDGSGNVFTTGAFNGTVDFDPGTGTHNLTSVGGTDIFVSKLNNNGNYVWAKSMGGSSSDTPNAITVDTSGNVLTTGSYSGTADFDPSSSTHNLTSVGGSDVFISKLDNNGNYVWAKSMGGSSTDQGFAIVTDAQKNVYSTGNFDGTADFDPGSGVHNLTSIPPTGSVNKNLYISKLDENGNYVWAGRMGGYYIDGGKHIALTSKDCHKDIYVGGRYQGTADLDPGSPVNNHTATGVANIFVDKLIESIPKPTITTGADKTICSGESVSLSASGASSYSWNHGAGTGATPSVSPTTTTTYTVTGTTSGCSNTATQKVTVKPKPTVTTGADKVICSGESVSLSASGASSYSWNHGAGTSATPSVSPTTTTTYTVTGTTSGCSNTATQKVTVKPKPTVTTGTDKVICSGESVSLSASGASSYSWDHSVGTGASPSVSPTSTTTYTVTGTTNGCSNTATQKVTVNPTPTVVASTDQTICAGESVTISASGANTYSWNHSVGSGSSHSVSPSATTTYTVTGTSNSCTGTDDVTVTVNPLPTFTITDSVNPTACGNSDGTITLSGLQNNTSYSVSYNGNASTSMTTSGSGEITITGLPAGSYANFTIALNGCSTSDNTTTVNLQDPNAPTVNAGTDQTICSGDSITLTASNPDGATITWNNGVTDGQTFVPTVGNTDTTIAYTVTANKSGCTASDQVNITVSITPTAIASTTTSTLCAGETIVLTADTVIAGSYDWTGPNGFTSNNQQATVSNASQATAGTYILTITKNGCSATDSVSVTVNPSPTAQATSSSATYCKGQTANLQASGGGQYNWTGPNNFSSSTQNPNIPNFGQAGEGWYVVTVTNSSGCKDKDSVQLSIGGLTGLSITASDHQVCPGKDIVLTANGADSYTWSGPNGFSAIGSTVNLNNMSSDKAGTYYVTAQDSAGCTTTDTITVGIGMSSDCLFIPNLVTPNGDHKNDKWVITGIEAFPKAEVNIFNRWGNIVFHASPYKNNWKGQVNKGLDVGKGLLPSGTYFYVIKFNNGKDKDIKGYIELQY